MKDEYFTSLFLKYKNRGLLVDSNILLLYFIGKYSQALITEFKRTRQYTKDDFYMILNIFSYFKKIVTTPNILTEISNLSNQLTGRVRSEFYIEFRKQFMILSERYLPSQEVSESRYFPSFGLTDSVIIEAAKDNYLVLTDEAQLYRSLLKEGIDAININHLRAARWFSK